jgi:hypothetical protein
MGLNRVSQAELDILEAEIAAAFHANTYINQFEEMNLIGNQSYGKPELPEDSSLCEHSNSC